jgi:cobaltochelatase CobN
MTHRLPRLIRLAAALLLAAGLLPAGAQSRPAAAALPASSPTSPDPRPAALQPRSAPASVLILTVAPVPPGKFTKLAEAAAPLGLRLDARYVEKLPADVGPGLFAGHAAVLVDAPRDHLRDEVQARLAGALPALKAPVLWLHESRPQWSGWPDAVARRLHAYYVNGGARNVDGFLRLLAAQVRGEAAPALPEPIVFPKSAVYHPRAPQLVFADPAAYLAWLGPRRPADAPVIGIALHQAYIAGQQTAFIDDLIARIEAAGATALPFYAPVMDAQAISRMVRVDGKVLPHALINTQIMLNPEGRRAEFAALGVPVVQAMPYRRGDVAAWQADRAGVSLMDVPFYLAQAEYAGVIDIQIAAATRQADGELLPIDAQADAVVRKTLNLAALQRTPAADKRVAILFWNYPPGEKNLSASFMNLPRSLVATLGAMQAAGYRTEAMGEAELTGLLQRTLRPNYRDGELEPLLQDGLAELLPVATYRRWLRGLPDAVQRELQQRFGAPERSAMVVQRPDGPHFVIPRLKLGHVTLLPQPDRGERWEGKEKALYHSTSAAPSHHYLATYLWLREQFRAHALVHYGTHGTQEWLPGKERGLSVHDYPMLAVGDVPVIYPYIVDNIGEAVQAKRRGRAVIISHQTPAFRPAGLHASLQALHDLLHAWLAQDEGSVKDRLRTDLLAAARREHLDRDMGWSAARIDADFRGFVDALHDQLHELARTAQPLGLHTFGRGADPEVRLATLLSMLGPAFWEATAGPGEEADEVLVGDWQRIAASSPYRLLYRHLVDGVPIEQAPAALQGPLQEARRNWDLLGAANELPALLAALDGRHIPTSYGGDPIRNPEALPTGRNLYGFDPSRVPTPQAWAAGKAQAEALIAAHRAKSGQMPRKLAFSLWSVETMRHQGLLEAQALWTLGVEPVWDGGGRVVDVKLVPREQLGRPRVDAILSATGLYRDHFPNTLKLLAKAAALAAQADEADNPAFAHTREVRQRLLARGVPAAQAEDAALTRIFSSASGNYGTGLDDAALATDTWKGQAEGDRKLAQLYLARMQFAYGPDESRWGQSGADLAGPGRRDGKSAPVNLYAEHLRGTEGAVLSRTSNLYGMLTTDDPFQYLGGIALAVRHLDGKPPQLYISNLREAGAGRVEGADAFLAKELATRQFHPGYIKGLMGEGYAGTLQVLDSINNFLGWTTVSRETVRDDQWESFADVYVRDRHQLKVREWFERHNPHALAQTIERMLEAARQGYWQADARTVAELKATYRDLAARHDVHSDNAAFNAYVGAPGAAEASGAAAASGYGLRQAQPAAAPRGSMAPAAPATSAEPAAAMPPPPPAPSPAPAPPPIRGLKLERVPQAQPRAAQDGVLLSLLLLAATTAAGAWRAARGTGAQAIGPLAARALPATA